jgi:transcriptional regulator with XRE-family HTH domain
MVGMNSKQWFDAQHEAFENDPEYVAEGLALDVVIALGRAMRDQGLTQSELARRIGASPAFVSQTLHGKPNMTLLTLAKFSLALGLECSVSLTPRPLTENPESLEDSTTSAPLSKAPPRPRARPKRKPTAPVTAAK